MRVFYLLLPLLLFACQQVEEPAQTTDQLGELHEAFSVNATAQPHFERGLLLLHNFEYEDAREAFLEAQALDSNAVMNYWGEAMTYNHPLWRRQEFEDGVAALEKLGADAESRAARAATDLERGFLQGAEILFGAGEKDVRDQAYSDHMKMLYEKYPGHEEVATFYALSILGAVPVGRDIAAYEAGAEVAKGVLANNPNHPGALHYLIHSYDDPTHAPLALEAAASYSQVAADAVHALHMPSHIFLAVGMWEEVVSSNIASFAASQRRMEEKGLDYDALSYHALSWLQYGHLQLGNFEEAKQDHGRHDRLYRLSAFPTRPWLLYCHERSIPDQHRRLGASHQFLSN
jgi:tetratricopeptide (TPR) repeat protein